MMTWLFAVVIGFALGMLGGGGSILTVPVFVYAAHFDPKTAIAMSFPVVGLASLVGAITHWRAGTVAPRVALTFGAITMAGAVVGARLATLITGATQLLILSIAILAAAISMLRGGPQPVDTAPAPTGWRDTLRPVLIIVGLAVGVLTGLVGIGGGFLIVPALIVLARVPMRAAVGTSLVVIAMNSTAALVAHAAATTIPVTFVATFTAIAIVGVFGGVRAAHRVPVATLRRVFAVFLLLIGSAILYQSRGVISAALTSLPQIRSAA